MKKLITAIAILISTNCHAQTSYDRKQDVKISNIDTKVLTTQVDIGLLRSQDSAIKVSIAKLALLVDSMRKLVICFDSNHVVTRKNDTTIVSMKPKKIF